jgi:lipopolysaccharide/colanic/teichoic acid biosynthesis glycosyltransferase
MAGLLQMSGRSDLPRREAVRLDLRYAENLSLSMDMVTMLRTLTIVARRSGVY